MCGLDISENMLLFKVFDIILLKIVIRVWCFYNICDALKQFKNFDIIEIYSTAKLYKLEQKGAVRICNLRYL